jgi:hypothetical protein
MPTSNPGPVKMLNVAPGEILRVQDMWGLLNLGDLQTALALTLLFIPLPLCHEIYRCRVPKKGSKRVKLEYQLTQNVRCCGLTLGRQHTLSHEK